MGNLSKGQPKCISTGPSDQKLDEPELQSALVSHGPLYVQRNLDQLPQLFRRLLFANLDCRSV